VTPLVATPPLPELNTTLLLNAPAPAGVKLTTTLVAPKPGTVKLVPDTTLKGGLALAAPPVTAAPPRLVTTNVCCALVPTATQPKAQFAGDTAIWPGVKA